MKTGELQTILQPFFEDLHMHPELGLEEKRTTQQVKAALTAAGIPYLDQGLETGLVAVIRGGRPGHILGLRCDMDALPVTEESGLPYASTVPGKMHACGHDFHTTAMLGAAMLLNEMKDSLPGTVKIVFQPAEEIDRGAFEVVDSGLVADAEAFFGIHTYPGFPAGELGIKEGPVMAAIDRFGVIIRGRGTHAAQPHKGMDPIPATAAVIQALQTLITRRSDPFAPAILSVTHVDAGTTWNVIPEQAFFEGTVRTLDAEQREMIRKEFKRMAENISESFGCTAEVDWFSGSPAVVNDPELCALAREIAEKQGFLCGRQEDTMGAEDFSEYLKQAPGVFIRVGTGGEYPAHHPKFTVDPSVLAATSEYTAALAKEWLCRAAQKGTD